MTSRLAIMVCYSASDELEKFKKILIESVQQYASHFVVALNSKINEADYAWLEKHCSQIILRDNIGYDAGAYKDIICKMPLQHYDELLLLNDTFFGFFYPLAEFFDKVKSEPSIDFWGMTRHPHGYFANNEPFEAHIQSYFLLICTRMLHSATFLNFWEEIEYPRAYWDAVKNFEIRFSAYFRDKGFRGAAYCDLDSIGIYDEFLNPFIEYPYELVKELRCPVLKRKSFFYNNKGAWDALGYIRDNHLYDTNIIENQVLQDYRNSAVAAYFDLDKLEDFLQKYTKIYIYGKGRYAADISSYLRFRGISVYKYIVSNKKNQSAEDVIEITQLKPDETSGIIVALKPQYTQEVLGELLKRVSGDQLFLGKV